jgi:hypothetical protein
VKPRWPGEAATYTYAASAVEVKVPVGTFAAIQLNRSRLDGNEPEQLCLVRGIGPVKWKRGKDVYDLIALAPPTE